MIANPIFLHKATAEYEQLPGWDEDISGVRSFEDLPEAARGYIRYIEGRLGIPVVLIGVGPARDQVIPGTGSAAGAGVRSERPEQQLV